MHERSDRMREIVLKFFSQDLGKFFNRAFLPPCKAERAEGDVGVTA